MMIDYSLLDKWINLSFSIVVVALLVIYIKWGRQMKALSKRVLLVGFFFAIYQLSFILNNYPGLSEIAPFVTRLTELLFVIVLFYVLVHMIQLNEEVTKRLRETEKLDKELKDRINRLVSIKEKIK